MCREGIFKDKMSETRKQNNSNLTHTHTPLNVYAHVPTQATQGLQKP